MSRAASLAPGVGGALYPSGGGIDELFEATYASLRRIAAKFFRREVNQVTLQPTALVNEAYLELQNLSDSELERDQFLGIAARAMRRVLVNEARRRGAHKRGGGLRRVTLSEPGSSNAGSVVELLDLDAALCKLEAWDPRKATVVQLRYFAGLSIEEVAEVMGLSVATVNREWRKSRAWLAASLEPT